MNFKAIMKPLRCLLVTLSLFASAGLADTGKPISETREPADPAELRAMQKQVRSVLDKVLPSTVAVRIGSTSGSGVIVSKEGHILTAGHVSGESGRDVVIYLQNGKRLKGKTLGGNFEIDSGMIKITDEGDWPYVDLGKSSEIKAGQWVLCVGHPGGYQPGRTPVVRFGRVQNSRPNFIHSDCPMVGGDSGGPLFDLSGKVVGINSRIDVNISHNIHVPVDEYRETWDRLAKGETWGGRPDSFLGVRLDPTAKECRVTDVVEGSPAAEAGLKPNDVIKRFHGSSVEDADRLIELVAKIKPGTRVNIEVSRGGTRLTLKAVIGKREE